ncbi:unnamed protein product [Rhizoctonia solani]|uniref:Uncharacterized protein n=1 Tax=Rhizoctonia solani TaxID=456999 RepID=A0A8H3A0Y1_9AGAM|nr:unnamed protein product [Rhizoctonia solani]
MSIIAYFFDLAALKRTNVCITKIHDRVCFIRKKCDETKPQCLRCLASGNNCVYEYVEYRGEDAHRIRRTKPGPRATFKSSSRSSSSVFVGPSESETSPMFMPYIPGDPTILDYSCSSKASPPPHLSPTQSWGIINPAPRPLMSPAPSYISPTTYTTGSSVTGLDVQLQASVPQACDNIPVTYGSTSQSLIAPVSEDEEDHTGDLEGVRHLLCMAPVMDMNVQDNSLPFVLQCYSNWIIARIFDPLKIAHAMRDQVIRSFSSETVRTRTILIANVMNKFARDLVIGNRERTILNSLALNVRRESSRFLAGSSLVASTNRGHAMRILDSMLEKQKISTLQTSTLSMQACLQSFDDIAPIFRSACLEPPGQPVNLPNILLDPNLNLRHFATLDIVKSVASGQPTYFRYEVPFSLELCDQVSQMQDKVGLQWLHGLPDQFMLLLAWIMSLCEIPGASEDSELVTWIETIVPQIKIVASQSGDPLLRLGRTVVQECWRFAVLIYLYMAFCGVSACDPRVVRAQKSFLRLVRGIKPARNPDAFIFIPMALAGLATIEERDCNTIRQRFLNVRECAEPGTTGNETLLILEDIWSRTRSEGRVAVWSDLGIARFRVIRR